MRSYILNHITGTVFKENDTIRRPALASTLRAIAGDSVNGGNLLYMDTLLMRDFVDDLRALNGTMVYEDMLTYT